MTIHNSATCMGIVGFRQYIKDNIRVLIRYAFTEKAKTHVYLNDNRNWVVSCNIAEIIRRFQVGTIFRSHHKSFADIRFIEFIDITKMRVWINDIESVKISVRGLKELKMFTKQNKFRLQVSYKIIIDKTKKIVCLILIFRRRLVRYKEKITKK